MKTSRYYLLAAGIGVFLISATPTFAQSTGDQSTNESTSKSSKRQTIDISQVPQPARNAAEKALGTAPTDAKVVVGTSPQEYELMAKNKSGKTAKVHVLADGTVMKRGKPQREAQAPTPMPR
jgi:hypothetical protein